MTATPVPTGDWAVLLERFEALGEAAQVAAASDDPRLGSLLAARDVVLAELTDALASARGDRDAQAALELAAARTQSLITQVAERTDALRQALRTLERSTRAADAYHPAGPGARSSLDARR